MVVGEKKVSCLGWEDQQVIWVGCSQRYRSNMINVEARRTRGIWNYGIDVTMPYQIKKTKTKLHPGAGA